MGGDNNVSVRKNFTPVPIYLPSVKVGDDGVAKITVKLPELADGVQASRQGRERT